MNISDLDLIEVNEAFSSVVLRFLQAFDADPAKVNVNGGAIAMGHPLGATGAMIIARFWMSWSAPAREPASRRSASPPAWARRRSSSGCERRMTEGAPTELTHFTVLTEVEIDAPSEMTQGLSGPAWMNLKVWAADGDAAAQLARNFAAEMGWRAAGGHIVERTSPARPPAAKPFGYDPKFTPNAAG